MGIFKLLILLAIVPAGNSFSGGTGACFAGDSNVRGPHNSNLGQPAGRTIVTGSLADGGLQVLLGGVPLRAGSLNYFSVGEEYTVRVVGEEDYRGILIRLQAGGGVDTTAALVVEDDATNILYDASICSDPIQGITHSSNVLKNNVGGLVRIDELTDVFLGVTIVEASNDTNSIYYFSQFQLEVTLAPTAAPTRSPTRIPTPQPSRSPTRNPTPLPTRRPTNAPTKQPTRAPSPRPTTRPTRAPTRVPTRAPTRVPTARPSRSPTKNPTRAPSPRPTARPTQRPTKNPTRAPSPSPTTRPSRSPTKNPTRAPSPRPTNAPTRAPTSAPKSAPTRAPTDQPTVLCVAAGNQCTINDTCCGDGANICIGVCSRNIKPVDKDADKTQYKLSDGARVRGGTSRRKLLKGSRPNQEY